jgi:hypothetical protein
MKKKNIGFNRATADASREGDKEPPGEKQMYFAAIWHQGVANV